jgi:1-acylglycerone phosphate reductase
MASLSKSIERLVLDVTRDEDVERVVETVIEKEGRIDILINNAGVHCVGSVLDIPLDQFKATMEANTFGVLRLVKAVVPHMAQNKQGLIVNVGSPAGHMFVSVSFSNDLH